MADFYIVAREKNTYSLITINGGNNLEDIDVFTSNFKSREDFINYLRNQGHNISDDVDLYAVNKGRKEIYHRELIFGKGLDSLSKYYGIEKVDFSYLLDNLVKEAKHDSDLADLIRNRYFQLYGDLRDIVLDSKEANRLKLSSKKNWMRYNYFVVRDAVAASLIYDEISDQIIDHDCSKLLEERKKLEEERSEIDHYLAKKIHCENEQISIVGEPEEYINLTYANVKKLKDSTPKKVVRISKTGPIDKVDIEKLTIPYEVYTDKIDYSRSKDIVRVLTSIPYHRVKWGQKERYEIDFRRLSQNLDREFSEEDMKFLNSLLDGKLRKYSYLMRYYHNQDYPSPATYREEKSYQRSIYNKLHNAALKEGKVYDDAYNFCLIYQAIVKDLDKDNQRGGYGR